MGNKINEIHTQAMYVHGDICAENVMIDLKLDHDFNILYINAYLVDTQFSKKIGNPAVCFVPPFRKWYAPELLIENVASAHKVASHPGQDVYSFAYLIKSNWEFFLGYSLENEKNTCVRNCILSLFTKNKTTHERPSMSELVTVLEYKREELCTHDYQPHRAQLSHLFNNKTNGQIHCFLKRQGLFKDDASRRISFYKAKNEDRPTYRKFASTIIPQ